ncbi:uncharacterized protein LOC108676598 [Hyalella azteca]|uniref:Uncharacterized protein LOC108676598 n=1 Tax=Hyalella azteca TaxID=294128 RepID=A0A8B7P260_HYAAZ|nr:uncharacterized protein LOC108676598 [Hyalella azteca]XP_018020194.1 uncharacterized protein LOC108676598 [Hyalella azteca]
MIQYNGISASVLVICLVLLNLVSIAVSASARPSSALQQCSAPKERMRKALSVDHPHIRKKRTIQVPKGTGFECKWALNMPFETQRRYNAKLQMAIPIIINIPAIYFERYGLEKLKGFVEDEEDEKIEKIDTPEKDQGAMIHTPEQAYNEEPLPAHHYIQKRDAVISNYSTIVQEERLYFYRIIEGLLDKLGLPSKDCMLRTVCEVARDPIEYGLYGDLFNMLMSPTMTSLLASQDGGYVDEIVAYVRAEKVGHITGRCHDEYEICPVSLFDLLPLVVNNIFSSA